MVVVAVAERCFRQSVQVEISGANDGWAFCRVLSREYVVARALATRLTPVDCVRDDGKHYHDPDNDTGDTGHQRSQVTSAQDHFLHRHR